MAAPNEFWLLTVPKEGQTPEATFEKLRRHTDGASQFWPSPPLAAPPLAAPPPSLDGGEELYAFEEYTFLALYSANDGAGGADASVDERGGAREPGGVDGTGTYGAAGAARVAALEAELNAAFDAIVDARKPRHWPAIALNPAAR